MYKTKKCMSFMLMLSILNPIFTATAIDDEYLSSQYKTYEGDILKIENSSLKNIENIELFGNSSKVTQDEIQSVGDVYVDGEGNPILDSNGNIQYKITLLIENMLDKSNPNYEKEEVTLLLPRPLKKYGSQSDRLFWDENKGKYVVEYAIKNKDLILDLKSEDADVENGVWYDSSGRHIDVELLNFLNDGTDGVIGDKIVFNRANRTYGRINNFLSNIDGDVQEITVQIDGYRNNLNLTDSFGEIVSLSNNINTNNRSWIIADNDEGLRAGMQNGTGYDKIFTYGDSPRDNQDHTLTIKLNANETPTKMSFSVDGEDREIVRRVVGNENTGTPFYFGKQLPLFIGSRGGSNGFLSFECSRIRIYKSVTNSDSSEEIHIVDTNITNKITIPTFEDTTYITTKQSNDLKANIKIEVDESLAIAKDLVNIAIDEKTSYSVSKARSYINKLPESMIKDQLQEALNSVYSTDIVLELKTTTSNLDLYIKSENMLSMVLDTNSITFEDFSGVEDLEKINAINITINSSLPYSLNAYLPVEMQNSDKSNTMDKQILNIKENSESVYQTFDNTIDKIVLKDYNLAGNDIVHGIDIKLNGSIAHEKDVYKTIIKFEAEQK